MKLHIFQTSNKRTSPWYFYLLLTALIVLLSMSAAHAQDSEALIESIRNLEQQQQAYRVDLDTVWVIFSGSLIFFMNAGFAMLEAGFCQNKNSITVLAKNLIVFGIAAVAFSAVGFMFMFGDSNNGLIGTSGVFLISPSENSPTTGEGYKGVFDSLSWAGVPLSVKFFFQLTFASTAATIVSGAVAERIKFTAFVLFTFLFVGILYPLTGHWVWGGGWLADLGFWDFAGSCVVHSTGGCAGLMGAVFLSHRLNRYTEVSEKTFQELSFKEKTFRLRGLYKIEPMYADNLALSTLGCLILWLGWFGFNAGSTMAANAAAITHILLNTTISASTGGLAATIAAWLYFEKPSISFLINGILAGCVGITASCAYVSLSSAAIIGVVASFVVIFATVFLDKLRIDDPVGAIPVHLFCGFWGTIAVGLFSEGSKIYGKYGILDGPTAGLLLGGGFDSLYPQLIGFGAIILTTGIISSIFWLLVSEVLGSSLRVTAQEELTGLDLGWADFNDS